MRCDFIFPPSVYPARLRRNGGWKPFFRPACRVPRIGQRLISFWFMAAEVIGLGTCISKPHQLVKIMAFILTGRSVTKSLASPSVVNIFPYLLSGGGHPFDLVPRISEQMASRLFFLFLFFLSFVLGLSPFSLLRNGSFASLLSAVTDFAYFFLSYISALVPNFFIFMRFAHCILK